MDTQLHWKPRDKVHISKNRFYLIKSTSFDREILNPALARASTLSDDSTVLNVLVLKMAKSIKYPAQVN